MQLGYIILYFIYGLSFYTMGITSWFSYSRKSFLLLRRTLIYLALFGVIHGFTEWLIMFNRTTLFSEFNILLSFLISSSFVLSFVFLGYFGLFLSNNKKIKPRTFHFIVVFFVILIVTNFANYFFFSQGYLTLDYYEFRFLNRIFSALPASLFSTISLFKYAQDKQIKSIGKISLYIRILAFFFLIYTLAVGIIGENVNILWASWVNHESFIQVFKFPIELVRIFSAVSISITVFFIINQFEYENRIQQRETDSLYLRSFEHKKTASLLHDMVLQNLFYVNLKIDEQLANQNLRYEELNKAKDSIRQVMDDIRTFLNSPTVRHVSIQEVQSELQQVTQNMKTKFKNIDYTFSVNSLFFGHQNTFRLEHIKYIVQECLVNAIKHAQASKILVVIDVESQGLEIKVIDNGKGFSVQRDYNGFGIESIKHRIKMCEGTIIQETNIKGTSYIFTIPWIWE